MGDLASSRKTSQTNTTVNRQVGQQGQTNSAFTGDINIDQSRKFEGNSIPGHPAENAMSTDNPVVIPGSNNGSTVNIDLSTGDKELALAAIEKVAQSSNTALLNTLSGTAQIVNRTIDFADNTQSKFADAIQPSLPTAPGKQAISSETKLVIGAGLLLATVYFNKQKS